MSGVIPWELVVRIDEPAEEFAVARFAISLKIAFENNGYQVFDLMGVVGQTGFIVSAMIVSSHPLMSAKAFSFLPEWGDFIGAF